MTSSDVTVTMKSIMFWAEQIYYEKGGSYYNEDVYSKLEFMFD